MNNIYTSGEYLHHTETWHAEDASWKAGQILKIMGRNGLNPVRVAEIGCGSGAILHELAQSDALAASCFAGYDISPQAIDIAQRVASERVEFVCGDLAADDTSPGFDLLLAIDVLEHVPDYWGFLEACRRKAKYKIFHIPLDIHVSSVMRNAFIAGRYSIGHLHYFTSESALAVLRDTGHEVVDSFFTNGASGLYSRHPSAKRAVANGLRWMLARFSVRMTARILGGYSLMVLTK